MILYLDSSALVKRYLDEDRSDDVVSLVARARTNIGSIVTYPEIRAALARAHRGKRLDESSYADVLARFESDWADTTQLEVSSALTSQAGELAARYHLRGFDAIHVASASGFQRGFGEAVTFLAFDDRLMAAAKAEGLLTGG